MKRRVERGMMREGGFVCGRTFWWGLRRLLLLLFVIKSLRYHSANSFGISTVMQLIM